MKSFIKFFLLGMASLLLVGCFETNPQPPVLIEKIKTVVVSPPAQLLLSEPTPAPTHPPAAYAELSCESKEESNFLTILALYQALKIVNDRQAAARDWVDKQNKLYQKE